MAEDLWFDNLHHTLLAEGLLNYHPPMKDHSAVQIRPFGPYDIGGGIWQFGKGIRFDCSSAVARDIYAMTLGSLVFTPGVSDGPGRLVLVRGDLLGLSLTRTIGMLPSWFPAPAYIVYDNVDTVEVRQAAIAALTDEALARPALQRLKQANPSFQLSQSTSAAEQLADQWMAGQIPDGLFALAGQRIGACAPDSGGQGYFFEFSMAYTADPDPEVVYNPAYFMAQWHELGWMKDAPPQPALTDTGGPPSGSGVIRTVSGGGDHTIADAIAASAPGDTVLVTDALTYFDTIIIDKPVNLISTATLPTSHPLPDYPVLNGQKGGPDKHRPVTFSNVSNGVAFIGKFSVEDGWATGAREDGGGILVENGSPVVISSCVVTRCEAVGGGLFGEGFGGGIAVYHSSPAILGCLIKFNQANSRGNGIGVFGYGWPTIADTVIMANEGYVGGENPRHDGGGIGIEIAVTKVETEVELGFIIMTPGDTLHEAFNPIDLGRAAANLVRICRCSLLSNIAADDGGGLYVTSASRVLMRHTDVLNNQSYSNGGGIRATFGSSLFMRDCSVNYNHSQANNVLLNGDGSEKKAGGGGIATRNMKLVDLVRTEVRHNVAHGWAGGGLSFVSTDEGRLPGWVDYMDFDWNDFLWNPAIYKHDRAVLRIDADCEIASNEATCLTGLQTVDHGKGGGLYVLRWKGARGSEEDLPAGFEAADGDMESWPASIYIFNSSTLVSSNIASFKEQSIKETKRMYVENMVLNEKFMDEDITQSVVVLHL